MRAFTPCSIKEEHGHAVWCVVFNDVSECNHDIFASCGERRVRLPMFRNHCSLRTATAYLWHATAARMGSNADTHAFVQATVYQCLPTGRFDILQAYQDDDVSLSPYSWSCIAA